MKKNEDGQGKFPDLSGDGKVTMKDILIGRGVVKKAEGGANDMTKDPRYIQLMDAYEGASADEKPAIASDLFKEFGVKLMGGGSVDDAMKYGGGGNIMIKTVEVSMKVPEKQKRGTGAAMTGTKFSGTF